MKTGDAEATFWLEGLRHYYCCEVVSERKGQNGRVRYFWKVEMMEMFHDFQTIHETKWKACRTFADGLRLSRRMADYLERKRIEVDNRRTA